MNFCPHCGAGIGSSSVSCWKCGLPPVGTEERDRLVQQNDSLRNGVQSLTAGLLKANDEIDRLSALVQGMETWLTEQATGFGYTEAQVERAAGLLSQLLPLDRVRTHDDVLDALHYLDPDNDATRLPSLAAAVKVLAGGPVLIAQALAELQRLKGQP